MAKEETNTKQVRPALTPEARERHLTALAYDLVEKRLIEGTATSQETTHFLKMGSPQALLEQKKIELEIKMIEAKTEQLKSQANSEKMFADAIKAMKSYQGKDEQEDDEYGN